MCQSHIRIHGEELLQRGNSIYIRVDKSGRENWEEGNGAFLE
jgi:hypothetical protein